MINKALEKFAWFIIIVWTVFASVNTVFFFKERYKDLNQITDNFISIEDKGYIEIERYSIGELYDSNFLPRKLDSIYQLDKDHYYILRVRMVKDGVITDYVKFNRIEKNNKGNDSRTSI